MTSKREFRSFEKCLIEILRDPEEAQVYIKVVLEAHALNGDLQMLKRFLDNITQAQGSISDVLKRARISQQFLDDILSKKSEIERSSIFGFLKNLG